MRINAFLDASSHLYKRVCLLVRRSVCPSIRWLVGRSVGPLVHDALIKNAIMARKLKEMET